MKSYIGIEVSGAKVYPDFARENAKAPYVIYFEVGQPTLNTLKGPTKLQQHLVQFESYANSKSAAQALSKAVEEELLAQNLDPDASPPGRYTARQVGARDAYDPDVKLYLRITEWSIWTRE